MGQDNRVFKKYRESRLSDCRSLLRIDVFRGPGSSAICKPLQYLIMARDRLPTLLLPRKLVEKVNYDFIVWPASDFLSI